MQAGLVAEWASAPFAIGAGAIALAVIGYVFLGARLNKLGGLDLTVTNARDSKT